MRYILTNIKIKVTMIVYNRVIIMGKIINEMSSFGMAMKRFEKQATLHIYIPIYGYRGNIGLQL